MDITAPQVWIGWIIAGLAAYLGVYLAEKAKRRAAHEDSDQIRAELARNTQAVKEIEAKVNSDLWDRQWRLNQKRDVYARLIEGLGELQFTIGANSRLTKLKDPADAGLVSDLYGRTKTLLMELERSRAVARIFLSSEAVAAIDEFEHEFQQPLKGDTGDAVKVFSRATERLTSAAKDELGLK